jgi:hypothetical protein
MIQASEITVIDQESKEVFVVEIARFTSSS